MKSWSEFQKYARTFIIILSVIILGLSCNSSNTGSLKSEMNADLERPNIIWIVGENLNLDLNFVNEGPLYDTEDWSTLSARQPFFCHD